MAKHTSWRGISVLVFASLLLFFSPFFQRTFPQYATNPIVGVLVVLLLALPSFIATVQWLGARIAVLLLSSLALFAFAIETIGLQTGFPYSPFTYGSGLGPLLPGGAPFALPFAYVPLVLGALWLTFGFRKNPVGFILAFALTLVCVDLVLDPGAVVLGQWAYLYGGVYYGVPFQNFAGWLLSSAIAGTLVYFFVRNEGRAPSKLLLSSLFLQLVYWTGVAFWYALWIPFVLGALLIGSLVWIATFRVVRSLN